MGVALLDDPEVQSSEESKPGELFPCPAILSPSGSPHKSATNPAFTFSGKLVEKQIAVIRESELSWEATLPASPRVLMTHSLQPGKKARRRYLSRPSLSSPSSAS